MLKKVFLGVVAAIVVAAVGVYAAFQLSPWPSVWLIRHAFDEGSAEAAASIAGLVPANMAIQRGLQYAPGDDDALLGVYAPADAEGPLAVVVWVHGGGFISGSRSDLANYLQILASRGFVTVAIDYTIAPEAGFPTPLRQTGQALAFVRANAGTLGIDPDGIFLAGDSAGAQIAAQMALVISDAPYAERLGVEPGIERSALSGVILFCGPYDPATMSFEGPFGGFMRTVIWSYLGTRDPQDARVAQLSVAPHVVAAFPPAFISVGNADPLAPQSRALAEALEAVGVEVDTLFFPDDHSPPLAHEYQLLLSTQEGRLALDRSVAFLAAHSSGR
jgi:acetyl esterase/lipase